MIIISDNQWELLNTLAKTNIMDRFLRIEGYPESVINANDRWDALEAARIINMNWFNEMFDSLDSLERLQYMNWRAAWSNIEMEDDKEVAND